MEKKVLDIRKKICKKKLKAKKIISITQQILNYINMKIIEKNDFAGQ